MEVKKIGSRGTLFTFSDLVGTDYDCTTNVYVIEGREQVFVCDTFLGPDSMQAVKEYIATHMAGKPLIIFNSHADWDHVWGNCAFASALIIAHQQCRGRLKADGEADLAKHAKFHRGEISLVLPNLTFQERMGFPEEGIEFFHSPGHTADSATCYDRIDRVLFVGDNLEDPIPYVTPGLLEQYVATLKRYLSIGIDTIIPVHGEVVSRELVRRNLQYIERFRFGQPEECTTDKYRFIHQCNLDALRRAGEVVDDEE